MRKESAGVAGKITLQRILMQPRSADQTETGRLDQHPATLKHKNPENHKCLNAFLIILKVFSIFFIILYCNN